MDLGIEGKVALVTGGSRGIGLECAKSLAQEGVNVAICGRTEKTLTQTVDELTDMGVKSVGIKADIADLSTMEFSIWIICPNRLGYTYYNATKLQRFQLD